MPNIYNNCTIIAYGPPPEVSSFLSAFNEATEAAGLCMYIQPTLFDG